MSITVRDEFELLVNELTNALYKAANAVASSDSNYEDCVALVRAADDARLRLLAAFDEVAGGAK